MNPLSTGMAPLTQLFGVLGVAGTPNSTWSLGTTMATPQLCQTHSPCQGQQTRNAAGIRDPGGVYRDAEDPI